MPTRSTAPTTEIAGPSQGAVGGAEASNQVDSRERSPSSTSVPTKTYLISEASPRSSDRSGARCPCETFISTLLVRWLCRLLARSRLNGHRSRGTCFAIRKLKPEGLPVEWPVADPHLLRSGAKLQLFRAFCPPGRLQRTLWDGKGPASSCRNFDVQAVRSRGTYPPCTNRRAPRVDQRHGGQTTPAIILPFFLGVVTLDPDRPSPARCARSTRCCACSRCR
jgi:hypothetical protein